MPFQGNTILTEMSGRFDTAFFIAIGSYIACNVLLGGMVSLRGLSLKDMGIMGRIYLAIRAAWNEGCNVLRGAEHRKCTFHTGG